VSERESFRVRFADLMLPQVEAKVAACHGRTRAERAEMARRKVDAFSLEQLIERWRSRAALARSAGNSAVAEAVDAYALHLKAGESVYDFEYACEGDAATIQACVNALVACDAERFALSLFNGEGARPSRMSAEHAGGAS
jgi:hypothetical protein